MTSQTTAYKPYPAYKPSGVEWLGGIPEHWHEKRLKYGCRLNPPKDIADLPADASVSFLPMEKVGTQGELQLDESRPLFALASGYTPFQENDVIVAKITPCFENGKGALCQGLSNGVGFGSTEFHVLRSMAECEPRFVYWLTVTDALRKLGKTSMTGVAGQQRVTAEFLANYITPFPPLPEQRAIADFLDRETGRIDAMIEKKRRLIELLEEKRSALISHAVTKGLDPDATMKDSGIEWLGQIPAHWEVKKLGFLSRIGNGSTPSRENPLYWTDGEYPWLNSGVVNHKPAREAEQFVTPLALRECHLPVVPPHSVLVGITGQGKTRGMSTMLTYEATINQHLAYIAPCEQSAEAGFLCWQLTAAYSILREISDGAGSTKGALTCEQLGQFRLAVPPLHEQESIASHLSLRMAKLDVLVAKNYEAIGKLQEYRTALISAAVTGGIDVRGSASVPNCRKEACDDGR